jgi:hypothetical protein
MHIVLVIYMHFALIDLTINARYQYSVANLVE